MSTHYLSLVDEHSSMTTVYLHQSTGASPNVRDPLGLTPLYYSMLDEKTNSDAAELLLRDLSGGNILA